jgi:hypothetical protein
MATAEQICIAIREAMSLFPGVPQTEESTPEQINSWPSIIVYPFDGNARVASNMGGNGHPTRWTVHTIRLLFTVPRKSLPDDLAYLTSCIDPIISRLMVAYLTNNFNNTVLALATSPQPGNSVPITWVVVPNEWSINTLSLRFTLVCLTEEDIIDG